MYTPGPPVRDKYWLPLGLNWNGKLRERAFANARSGAPDIPWPQVGIRPHSLLSNHGQATIIARLGCTSSSLRLKLYLDDKLLAAGCRPVWRSAAR